MRRSEDDTRLKQLIKQSKEIVDSPGDMYDLAGKRFALYALQLLPYFENNSIHIGIVGNPNRGKTSFAFSATELMSHYGLPALYFDLDDYTKSGGAISGSISWAERKKRELVPPEEINQTIADFSKSHGLVIGDFPGRADDIYQNQRVSSLDMAILMTTGKEDSIEWKKLLEESNIPTSRLIIGKHRGQTSDHDPIAPYIVRERKPFTIPMIIACTRTLVNIACIKDVSLIEPWSEMSQAERVVLEEVLDFEFAPIGIISEP